MMLAFSMMVVIALVAFLLTVIFLISYLFNRKKSRLRKAILSFVMVFVPFVLFYTIEKLFFSYNLNEKKEVLVASREAPIGGIVLKLYEDSTYELGNPRNVNSSGNYKLKADTLTINPTNTKLGEEAKSNTFVIKKGYLLDISDEGISHLEIHVNSLKK